MMLIIKRLGLLFLFLLLMIAALFAYVTMTNDGLQRAFSIGKGYLGDGLTVGSVQGKLIGPASVSDFAYKNAGTEISVESLSYDWHPKQLFSRQLNIETLTATGVTIRLPASDASDTGNENKEPFQLQDLKLPFSLEAKNLSVTDVNLYPPGADEPIVIDEILLRASGEGDVVSELELSVDAPLGNLQIDGMLNTSGDWPIAVDTQWNFNHEQYGKINGEGAVTGDLKSLLVKHEVTGPIEAQLDIEAFNVLGDPSWNGNLMVKSDDLGMFSEALAGIPVDVDFDTEGSLEKLTVDGTVVSRGATITVDTEVIDVSGDISWDGNIKARVDDLSKDFGKYSDGLPSVPVNLDVDTKGSLDELTLDGTLASGTSGVVVDMKVFDVTGDVSWDENIKADSEDLGEFSEGLAGMPVDLDVDTKGSLDQLTVDGTVTSGMASVVVDAEVFDVIGDISWDGNLNAKSDDLGEFSEGLTGIPLDLAVDTKGSLDSFTASGNIATAHELAGPVKTNFNVTGNLEEIVIAPSNVVFEQSSAEINYAGTVDLKTLSADLDIDWTELEYPLVADPKLVLSPEGSLKFSGSAKDYNVELNTQVQQELAGDLNIVLMASGTPDKITVNTLNVNGPPTSVYAVGVVDLKTRKVDIKGNWQDVRWPLVGPSAGPAAKNAELIRSSEAEFSVNGTLDDYQLNVDLSLSGKDIPEGDWTISARGNTESLSDLSLSGNVLEGQVDATGSVIFSPTPEWDLALNASGINPGAHWPEHEGRITLSTTTKGSITDAGPDLVANIQSLSGNYRGQELGGGGRVTLANGELSADGMTAKVGGATVDINGALGDDLDLTWKMNADQLADLVPGIKGSVELEGKLSGTRDEPKLEFDLAAEDFVSGAARIKQLSGGGVLDLSGSTASEIKLQGESLTLANYEWQSVKVDGGGLPADQQLTISLDGEASPDLEIALKGGIEGESWTGELSKLDLLETPTGDWKLHESVAIAASKESFTTNVLCMTNLPAVLCTDSNWSADAGFQSRLAFERFNSELFSDFMPPDIAIDAPLSGNVDFTMKPGGKPNATAVFDLPRGRAQYTSSGDVITVEFGKSDGEVLLEDDRVTSTVNLALGEIGTVNLETVITDLYGAQNLRGTVNSDVRDISLAGIGASQLSSIDGAFASGLQLGGTLKAPRLVGDVSLQGFGAEIPSLSLKLEDGNIRAVSDGNGQLNIEGQIKSGDGELVVGGFFNPESGAMELALKGDNFRVANAERQKAVISPDLKLKIDGDTISVLGELEVPSAFIMAGGDTGAIVESADVKVIDSTTAAVDPEENNSRVELGINVTLGDDVRVKAGQFDGALSGGLELEQIPGKTPTGSGIIEVVSGDFLVYGQKLTMERGRILFGGGPLDNPGLDFDVARDVVTYDVKAGAKIRGTAQAPTLELQSDPEQTDANTISYILFGKPVGTGISYTLGKFITPDLYVSYGIDLFDKVQAFNMRYRITDTVALIGTNSTISSADLIYTIER